MAIVDEAAADEDVVDDEVSDWLEVVEDNRELDVEEMSDWLDVEELDIPELVCTP